MKYLIILIGILALTSCKKKSPERCYNCEYFYRYQFDNQIEVEKLETVYECGETADSLDDSPQIGKFIVNNEEIEGKRELGKKCERIE